MSVSKRFTKTRLSMKNLSVQPEWRLFNSAFDSFSHIDRGRIRLLSCSMISYQRSILSVLRGPKIAAWDDSAKLLNRTFLWLPLSFCSVCGVPINRTQKRWLAHIDGGHKPVFQQMVQNRRSIRHENKEERLASSEAPDAALESIPEDLMRCFLTLLEPLISKKTFEIMFLPFCHVLGECPRRVWRERERKKNNQPNSIH